MELIDFKSWTFVGAVLTFIGSAMVAYGTLKDSKDAGDKTTKLLEKSDSLVASQQNVIAKSDSLNKSQQSVIAKQEEIIAITNKLTNTSLALTEANKKIEYLATEQVKQVIGDGTGPDVFVGRYSDNEVRYFLRNLSNYPIPDINVTMFDHSEQTAEIDQLKYIPVGTLGPKEPRRMIYKTKFQHGRSLQIYWRGGSFICTILTTQTPSDAIIGYRYEFPDGRVEIRKPPQ